MFQPQRYIEIVLFYYKLYSLIIWEKTTFKSKELSLFHREEIKILVHLKDRTKAIQTSLGRTIHRLRTPDEAFFSKISKTFGPIGQIGQINFGLLFGVFSAKLSTPILAL